LAESFRVFLKAVRRRSQYDLQQISDADDLPA
jgi:hypothetical protein